MAFSFFRISVNGGPEPEEELNKFLTSHRVLSVEKRFVDVGENSYWSFCIDYVPTAGQGDKNSQRGRGKVDYKEILSPREFSVFARLRELRKELAQQEAVPAYAVFTNEQLAHMVQRRATSKAQLLRIEGLGEARINKYGERLISCLAEQFGSSDEKDRQPADRDSGS